MTSFTPRSVNVNYELSESLKADGAIKGVVQLPKKALRKVIRKRRSRGYSRSVLRQAKKARREAPAQAGSARRGVG